MDPSTPATPAPREVDEFEFAGRSKAASRVVTPPRMAKSPVHLECVHTRSVGLPGDDGEANTVVFGRVVGTHIDEGVSTGGSLDIDKLQPIGRLGCLDYVAVREVFSMPRPEWPAGGSS